MKKRDDSKKEVTKIKLKKTKGSTVVKRTNQRTPDPWKEIRLKLKPLGEAYNKFREKQKIKKQKEEQRRLKEEEEKKLKMKVERKLMEESSPNQRVEEERRLKEEEEQKLKEQEKLETSSQLEEEKKE